MTVKKLDTYYHLFMQPHNDLIINLILEGVNVWSVHIFLLLNSNKSQHNESAQLGIRNLFKCIFLNTLSRW